MFSCDRLKHQIPRAVNSLRIHSASRRTVARHGAGLTSNRAMKLALENRFWSKVDKSGGENSCWDWTGLINANGYGRFKAFGKKHTASRFSYFLTHGEVPKHLLVCHSCDNRKCVNPAHLWLGTNMDNTQDAIKKGRRPLPKPKIKPEGWLPLGDKSRHNYKLTRQEVLDIFSSKESCSELCKKYNLHHSQIYRIKNKQLWKNILKDA